MDIVLYTFAVVFAVILGILLSKFYFTDRRRMTSETAGRVAAVTERVVIENDRRRTETEVVVEYTVSGESRELRRVLLGHVASFVPVGRGLRVIYNPADPAMAMAPEIAHLEIKR